MGWWVGREEKRVCEGRGRERGERNCNEEDIGTTTPPLLPTVYFREFSRDETSSIANF